MWDKIKEKIINKKDLLINGKDQWMVKVETSKFVIWEIPNDFEYESQDWLSFDKNFVVYSGYKEWLWIRNRKTFLFEVQREVRKCFIGKIINHIDVVKMFSINEIHSFQEKEENLNNIPSTQTVFAKCNESMEIMDRVHRDYISKHVFESDQIMSIEAVAGSGKTTTLIELMKKYSEKKILYIAFNKSLVVDIGNKIEKEKLKNVSARTFDSLMRDLYILKKGVEPTTIDLKPQNIGHFIEWFNGKNFKLKKYYTGYLAKFCNNTEFNDIREYCLKTFGVKKDLLEKIWELVLRDGLITFDTIRKFAFMFHWAKDVLDKKYDMILIDEAQDFDMVMLRILLDDTTIPKVFVGDPRQAIYQFRGCINAFEHLPDKTFRLEFYSTFRLGKTACSTLEKVFPGLQILSKQNNYDTVIDRFVSNNELEMFEGKPYVYLFRSWRNLLLRAQALKNCWIYQFDKQIVFIQQLHEKLQNANMTEDDLNEFSDDLPKFLLSLSSNDLMMLIENIKKNLVYDQSNAKCFLYTIHSYKGLEHDFIRVSDDVDLKEESNLYYVALTRGKKQIFKDGDLYPPMKLGGIVSMMNQKKEQNAQIRIVEPVNDKKEENVPIKIVELIHEKKGKTIVSEKSSRVSFDLFVSGKSIKEISEIRDFREETVRNHLIEYIPSKEVHWSVFMNSEEYYMVKNYLNGKEVKNTKLREIKDNIPRKMDYNKIEIAREWCLHE